MFNDILISIFFFKLLPSSFHSPQYVYYGCCMPFALFSFQFIFSFAIPGWQKKIWILNGSRNQSNNGFRFCNFKCPYLGRFFLSYFFCSWQDKSLAVQSFWTGFFALFFRSPFNCGSLFTCFIIRMLQHFNYHFVASINFFSLSGIECVHRNLQWIIENKRTHICMVSESIHISISIVFWMFKVDKLINRAFARENNTPGYCKYRVWRVGGKWINEIINDVDFAMILTTKHNNNWK